MRVFALPLAAIAAALAARMPGQADQERHYSKWVRFVALVLDVLESPQKPSDGDDSLLTCCLSSRSLSHCCHWCRLRPRPRCVRLPEAVAQLQLEKGRNQRKRLLQGRDQSHIGYRSARRFQAVGRHCHRRRREDPKRASEPIAILRRCPGPHPGGRKIRNEMSG
mmetsp:Transcript_148356/g.377187  ORF Transcript_148356/g.377187 Transcript_148356/m.377187 type:complete len:165 (-) Transcript_148356:287-781(-)